MNRERLFPLLQTQTRPEELVQIAPRALPWRMMAMHEAQARKNHDQTLEVLASRGGLGIAEAVCVLLGLRWGAFGEGAAADRNALPRLYDILGEYLEDNPEILAPTAPTRS